MRKKPILIALAAIGLSGAAQAQYPVSPQQGILPVTISGSPAGRFNLVASPFVKRTVAYFDATSAVSGTVVTSATSAFGDFTSRPHTLILLSGTERGFASPIISNTGTTITTEDAFPSNPAGSEFVVAEDYTLNNLIGDNSAKPLPAGWGTFGSFSAVFADQVLLVNPANGAFSTFFFRAGHGWRLSSDLTTPQGDVRIPLGTGFFVRRATSLTGNLTLDIEGELRIGQRKTRVKDAVPGVHTGNTIVANTNAVTTTLGNFGLVESGLAGSSAFNVFADRVIIPDSTGVNRTYYFNTTTSTFLLSSGGTSQNLLPIPAGSGVLVQRVSGTATTDFQHTQLQTFNP